MIVGIRPHSYRPLEFNIIINYPIDLYYFLIANKYAEDSFELVAQCKYWFSELEQGNLLLDTSSIGCDMHNFKNKLETQYG